MMSRQPQSGHTRVGSDTGPQPRADQLKELPKGYSEAELSARNWIDPQFRKKIKQLAGDEQLGLYIDEMSNLSNRERSSPGKLKSGSSKFQVQGSLESPSKQVITRSMSLQAEDSDLVEELRVMLRRRQLDFEKLANDYEHQRARWEIEREELWNQRDESVIKVKHLEEVIRGLKAELACRENIYRQQSRSTTNRDLHNQNKDTSDELRYRIENRDTELAAARQTTASLRDSIDQLQKPSGDLRSRPRYFSNEGSRQQEPFSSRMGVSPRQINSLEQIFLKLRAENQELRRVVDELARSRPAPLSFRVKEAIDVTKLQEQSLAMNNASLKRQIQLLNTSLEQAKSQTRILSAQLQKQSTELSNLRQCKGVELDINNLKQSIDKLILEKAHMNAQLASSKGRQQELKRTIDQLNQKKNDKQEVKKLESRIGELQSEISDRNSVILQMQSQIQIGKPSEDEQIQSKVMELQRSLVNLQKTAEMETQALTRGLQESYRKLREKDQQLSNIKQAYQSTIGQVQSAIQQCQSLEQSLIIKDQQLTNSQQAIKHLEEIVHNKEQETQHLRQQLTAAQVKAHVLEDQVNDLHLKSNNTTNAQLAELQIKLQIAQQNAQGSTTQLQRLTQQNQILRSQLQLIAQTSSQQLHNLHAQLSGFQQSTSLTGQELHHAQQMLSATQLKLQATEEELKAKEHELILTETMVKGELEALGKKTSEEIAAKDIEIEGLRRELEDRDQGFRELKQGMTMAEVKVHVLEADVEGLHQQKTNDDNKLATLNKEIEEIRQVLVQKDKEISNLYVQVCQKDNTIADRDLQIQLLKDSLVEEQEKSMEKTPKSSSGSNNSKITEENQYLKKQIESLKAQIDNLKVQNEAELIHIKQQYENALRINEQLRGIIANLSGKPNISLELSAIGKTGAKSQLLQDMPHQLIGSGRTNISPSFLQQTAEAPSTYQNGIEVLIRKYIPLQAKVLIKNSRDLFKKLNQGFSSSELLGLSESYLKALNTYLKQIDQKSQTSKNQSKSEVETVMKGTQQVEKMRSESEQSKQVPKLRLGLSSDRPTAAEKKLPESAEVSSRSGHSTSRAQKKPSMLVASNDIDAIFQKEEEQQENQQQFLEMSRTHLQSHPDQQSQASKNSQSVRSEIAQELKNEVKHKMQAANLKQQLSMYRRHPSKKGSK